MNVLLVVTGGIAVYKSCELVGRMKAEGHEVRVVMTYGATQFVTPLTFSALSGHPAQVEMFTSGNSEIEHIELAKWADKVVVAPATYNFIGKMASGIADDLATTVVAAIPAETPVFIAPAMNTKMWENPILQRNLESLKVLTNLKVIMPRHAILACGDRGIGAMEKPKEIVKAIFG